VCTEVVDASTLTDVLRERLIPDRELAAAEITLNGIPLSLAGGQGSVFGGDGPFTISTGDVTLQLGINEACISSSSTGFNADTITECCVEFTVLE
jgi:hypothetical protein